MARQPVTSDSQQHRQGRPCNDGDQHGGGSQPVGADQRQLLGARRIEIEISGALQDGLGAGFQYRRFTMKNVSCMPSKCAGTIERPRGGHVPAGKCLRMINDDYFPPHIPIMVLERTRFARINLATFN